MGKKVESSKGNGKSKFGNSTPGKSARGKSTSSIGSAHALSNEEKMRTLEASARQFNQTTPPQSFWSRMTSAFSNMMQRFSDWLNRPIIVVEVEEVYSTSEVETGGLLGASKALSARKQKDADDTDDLLENTANFVSGAGNAAVDGVMSLGKGLFQKGKEWKKSPEVQALQASSALDNLVKHHKLLLNDTRSHTYFFGAINLKVEKAEALGKFILAVQNATTMRQVDAAFLSCKGNYELFNTGQNVTTYALGLRTTTVALIEALAKKKDNPTASKLKMA